MEDRRSRLQRAAAGLEGSDPPAPLAEPATACEGRCGPAERLYGAVPGEVSAAVAGPGGGPNRSARKRARTAPPIRAPANFAELITMRICLKNETRRGRGHGVEATIDHPDLDRCGVSRLSRD